MPRRPSLPRRLPLAGCCFLALASCNLFGPSDEEQEMLIIHKQNSKSYYDRGEFPRAEQQCRLGLEVDPGDRTLRLTLAWTLLSMGSPEQLAEADDLFTGLIGIFPTSDYRMYLGRGLTRLQRSRETRVDEPELAGRLARLARTDLHQVLRFEPEEIEATYSLALLDYEDEEHVSFFTHSDRCLELLARRHRFTEHELEMELSEADRRRVEIDRRVDLQRARGLVDLRLDLEMQEGRKQEALQDLDRLAGFGDLRRSDYYNRALLREEAGELDGAVADYERFIALSTGRMDPEVERAVRNITRLRAELAERRLSGAGSGA